MSVEQFAAMPRDEAVDYELVEGELIEVSSATPNHAWVRDEIRGALREFLRRNPIGVVLAEVECRTTADTVRRPDISYFSRARYATVDGSRIPLPFPPDIAVEILSPSEKAIEVNRKIHEYLAGGSSEVWIIDADNGEIQIRSQNGARHLLAGDRLESPLLPGFSIGVKEALSISDISVR